MLNPFYSLCVVFKYFVKYTISLSFLLAAPATVTQPAIP
jgi:hypothetical protein